jgi:hypothetical protein
LFYLLQDADENRKGSSSSRRNLLANSICGEMYEVPFERIFCVEPKCYQQVASNKKAILIENFIRDEENTFEGFM